MTDVPLDTPDESAVWVALVVTESIGGGIDNCGLGWPLARASFLTGVDGTVSGVVDPGVDVELILVVAVTSVMS